MKMGIFVTLAALALAVFAVPDAHARKGHHRGPDVDQQIFGNIFTIDVDEDSQGNEDPTGNTTALVTAVAKGQPGKAQYTATLVFETTFLPDGESEDDNCPPDFPLKSEVISFEWGEIYNDGSRLAGAATEGQFVCLSADFSLAVAALTGPITGATGRFQGAEGSPWRAEASVRVGSNIATGTLTVDFN